MSEENKTKEILDRTFNELIDRINQRFAGASNQVEGLGKWMTSQLKVLERELKTIALNSKVMDFALTAVVQILEEKKILEPGEYRERANKLVRDSQLEVVDNKPSIKNKK